MCKSIKYGFIFTILFCAFQNFYIEQAFSQENSDSTECYFVPFDSSILSYLEELRLVCYKKDTALLHELIGDECFGWSCYGAEEPARVSSEDWIVFKNYFGLLNAPENSCFWNFFISVMQEDVNFSPEFGSYRIPFFNSWRDVPLYDKEMQHGVFDRFMEVPISDSLSLYEQPNLKSDFIRISVPVYSIKYDSSYKFKFGYSDKVINDFYELKEEGKIKGYISSQELIWWNFHFEFTKNDETNKWYVSYYEVCP